MMKSLKSFLGAVLIAATAFAATAVEASTEKRVALVMGNARYADAPLRNPANDARAMAASLRERGFEVILRVDATKTQMDSAIIEFGERLSEGATGLFFFAGHGMQVQGRNFLVPIDAKLTTEQRIKIETVDVDVILDQMQGARSKVNVVILDACRNNPFERRFRSANGGLAQINAPEGTLIAYATAPGKVAADGDGANGLYTAELLKALRAPGLKVEDVFKQVRINVARASNGGQTPWEASSLVGDFYFIPPAPAPAFAELEKARLEAIDKARAEAAEQTRIEIEKLRQELAERTRREIEKMRADATEKARLDAADRARLDAAERARADATEKARLDAADRSRLDAAERARLDIERARETSTPTVPPARVAAAVPAPPPTAASPLQQQAALPSPGAPVTAASFDGRYTAEIAGQPGQISMTMDISGTTITGFAITGRDTGGGICRLSGSIGIDGVIQKLDMDCPQATWTFSGRFSESQGSVSGETAARSVRFGSASIVLRKAGSVAASTVPVSFDGVYAAKFTMVGQNGFLNLEASLKVAGSQLSGWATISTSATINNYSADMCALAGEIDSATGDIRSLDMGCRYFSARLTGRFAANAASGVIEGNTEAKSPSDSRVTPVVWRGPKLAAARQ